MFLGMGNWELKPIILPQSPTPNPHGNMARQEILEVFDPYSLPEVNHETLIAGVDEVGRGALFGPVVAGAVVLPASQLSALLELGVKDSKKLTPKRRGELVPQIQDLAIAYHVSFATVLEIDRLNILQASLLAMQRAVSNLPVPPAMCLVDGKQAIPNLAVRQINLTKGDLRSPLIAAASILAKVWRDKLIIRIAAKYPQYGLANHKGYGTEKHREALLQYGVTPQHRLSFRPCKLNYNHE